jgi:hypothetical protein
MDDERTEHEGVGSVVKLRLKEASHEFLWAVIIVTGAMVVIGVLSSISAPKPLKISYVPPLSERLTKGFYGGLLAGLFLGAAAGIVLALLRIAKSFFLPRRLPLQQ